MVLSVKGLACPVNGDMCCKSQVVGMLSCFLNIVFALPVVFFKTNFNKMRDERERVSVQLLFTGLKLMQQSKDVVMGFGFFFSSSVSLILCISL